MPNTPSNRLTVVGQAQILEGRLGGNHLPPLATIPGIGGGPMAGKSPESRRPSLWFQSSDGTLSELDILGQDLTGRQSPAPELLHGIEVDPPTGNVWTLESTEPSAGSAVPSNLSLPESPGHTWGGRIAILSPGADVSTAFPMTVDGSPIAPFFPLDLKLDPTRRIAWIADTALHRVLQVNMSNGQTAAITDDSFMAPVAIAVDPVTGDVFVRAFSPVDLSERVVHLLSDGTVAEWYAGLGQFGWHDFRSARHQGDLVVLESEGNDIGAWLLPTSGEPAYPISSGSVPTAVTIDGTYGTMMIQMENGSYTAFSNELIPYDSFVAAENVGPSPCFASDFDVGHWSWAHDTSTGLQTPSLRVFRNLSDTLFTTGTIGVNTPVAACADTPDRSLYVLANGGATLLHIDHLGTTVLATVTLPKSCNRIETSWSDARVYLSSTDGTTIYWYNLSLGSPNSAATPKSLVSFAVNRATPRTLWTLFSDNSICAVQLPGGFPSTTSVLTDLEVLGLAHDSATGGVWVYDQTTVYKFTPELVLQFSFAQWNNIAAIQPFNYRADDVPGLLFPMPSGRSIAIDHLRRQLWWVADGSCNKTVMINLRSLSGRTLAVESIPSNLASNNGPVCVGNTLILTAWTIANATYAWTGPNGFTSAAQTVTVSTNATTDMSGTYTVMITDSACDVVVTGTTIATVNVAPTTPTVGNNGPVICVGTALDLTCATEAGATYAWTGPNDFTSTAQNPTVSATATTAMSGTYTVTVTRGGCPTASGSTTVTVIPVPFVVAGNNGPVCVGSPLSLSVNVADAIYAWTGTDGFTSTQQNPLVSASAITAMAGTYTVTVTVSNCDPIMRTTTVVVNVIPASPTAGNDGPVCAGFALSLTATTVAGATYSWTGPNEYTSNVQNPVIANPTVDMSGTYSVEAIVLGCPSVPATTNVTVYPIPATPVATNNGPVCVETSLTLSTATVAGATYAWTGPSSFTSAAQNPTVSPSATTAMAGVYSVTITVNGCTSPAGTTNVTVNTIPSPPTASSNSPVCVGATLQLTASSVPGGTYSWTGPNGFTSGAQNPAIENATVSAAGTYSVTVAVAGCVSSDASTTTVDIVTLPATPTATNNGPVCAGTTLNLFASTIADVTYHWTGPNGYASSVQNPTVSHSATAVMSGVYSVTATATDTGCSSLPGTTTATVLVQAPPTASSNAPGDFPADLCSGQTLNLYAVPPDGNAYDYHWTGPNGFTSTLQNPTLPDAPTMYGYFYVTVTSVATGCTSIASTTLVHIDATAPTPTAGNNGPYCEDYAQVMLTASTVPSATYRWTGPNGFTSAQQNPTVGWATLAMAGTYSVSTSYGNECQSPPATTAVVVYTLPSVTAGNNASSPGFIWSGATLNLTASYTDGGPGTPTYSWTGPNGFTSTAQNPSISNAAIEASGQYSVTVNAGGCLGYGSTVAYVVGQCSTCTNSSKNPYSYMVTWNSYASNGGGCYNGGPDGSNDGENAYYQWVSLNAGSMSFTLYQTGDCTYAGNASIAVMNIYDDPPSVPCATSYNGIPLPWEACNVNGYVTLDLTTGLFQIYWDWTDCSVIGNISCSGEIFNQTFSTAGEQCNQTRTLNNTISASHASGVCFPYAGGTVTITPNYL